MAGFKRSLGVISEITESSYAESVAGSSYLGQGVHQVEVQGVELWAEGDEHPWVEFTFADTAGNSRAQRYFFKSREWDRQGSLIVDAKGEPKTVFNKAIMILINSIVGNAHTGLNLANKIKVNPDLLTQFVGTKCKIEIGYPYKGNKISNDETMGCYVLTDIQTGELVEDEGVVVSGEDFNAVKAIAKELGYPVSYLKVKKVIPSLEYVDANTERLSTILSSESDAKTVGATGPAAVQSF